MASIQNPCQPIVPSNFPDQLHSGFIKDTHCNPFSGQFGCDIFNKGAKGCYRSTNNTNNIAVQCCYDSNNTLTVGPPGGGYLHLHDSENSRWKHFKVDVLPYLQCCIFSNECDKYYEKRPSVDSRHYVPPRPVWARGDPHFTTMDGTSYEFNPVGEFVYLQVPNTTVQARIKQYVDKNNVPKPASYFSAFAIKIYDDLILQIEFTATNNLQLKIDGVIWEEESLSLPEISAVINTTLISLHTITGLSFQFYNLNNMIHVITALQPSLKGQVSGLIGNWDDDPSNDFMLPNGTWIPKTSSPEDIHFKFGMSWATTNETSIFSYPDGLKWSDYQNLNFAPFFGQPTNSYPQCGNNSQCIFDAFVTGDVEVGLTNVIMEQTNDRQIAEYLHMQKTCSPNLHVLHASVIVVHNSDYTQVDYSIVCEPGYMLTGKSSVGCVEGKYTAHIGKVQWNFGSTTYEQGDSVTLKCSGYVTDASDKLKVSIRRPASFDTLESDRLILVDELLKDDKQTRYRMLYTFYSDHLAAFHLIINDVRDRDTGNYTCHSSKAPEHVATMQLTVVVPMYEIQLKKMGSCSEMPYRSPPSFVEGVSCGLACITNMDGYVHKAPVMKLMLDGKEDVSHLFSGRLAVSRITSETGQVQYTSRYISYYKTMQPMPHFNGRMLTCHAYYPQHKNSVMEKSVGIGTELVTFYNPKILCNSYSMSADVGSDISIECSVESNPLSGLAWELRKNKSQVYLTPNDFDNVSTLLKDVRSGKRVIELKINHVVPQNFGHYHIHAIHPVTSKMSVATVELINSSSE
ncbi:hypothetical protein HELRODRAFT_190685 [Helobdella robusta]|uniref:Ig-like domain-containing protein n=1 Tax=Helobdella robusta TaxID=6412 RepID=T1FS73_HELRO|nr:hypothetical protein HELRODRAFT_190685 [Helobdella robusta]ESO09004.1 hypothetical protein HELRODRAFT_190685 [Helobdella robusta]